MHRKIIKIHPIIKKKIKRFFNVIFINYLQFITYVRQNHTLWNIKNIKLRRIKVRNRRFFKTKNQNTCSSSNVREERKLLDYAMWGAPAPNSCKRANQKRIVISKLYANFKQFFFLRSKDRRPPTTHENR